ncbi:hypothetical protein [Bradyrhizobium sp. SYSU BS000235]|uniref:hypothetical protein n=1 Tax=Bradyrhizobium sp. SYSU BS000235 TaxID=3411332 RepID=UPI003C752CAC
MLDAVVAWLQSQSFANELKQICNTANLVSASEDQQQGKRLVAGQQVQPQFSYRRLNMQSANAIDSATFDFHTEARTYRASRPP